MTTHRIETHRDHRRLFQKHALPCGDHLDTVHGDFDEVGWKIYGKNFRDYMVDFSLVDRDKILPDFIDGLKQLEQPVIIDLMASAHALRSLATHELGKPIKGIAVGYTDNRRPSTQLKDDNLGITCIEGDLNKTNTWEKLKTRLAGHQAQLIMERGFGGLSYVPTRAIYIRAALAKMWKMLDPNGGMLLLQIPAKKYLSAQGLDVSSWIESLNKNGVYQQYLDTYVSRDAHLEYGLLMLVKNSERDLPDIFQHALKAPEQ